MAGSTEMIIPRGVWALGFVSHFMGVSSELVHSLLPVFRVAAMGDIALTVGLVEGILRTRKLNPQAHPNVTFRLFTSVPSGKIAHPTRLAVAPTPVDPAAGADRRFPRLKAELFRSR